MCQWDAFCLAVYPIWIRGGSENMKQVIFNVGGALSTYTEFDDKKVMVDIGKSDGFHPVTDFLLPLFKKRKANKSNGDHYEIDQLIISHPHNDHISGINEFGTAFYPKLLTCPNDNEGMAEDDKINWSLIEDSDNVKALRSMLKGRQPPLKSSSDQRQFIYYLPPRHVENTDTIKNESYCNNISIVVFFILGNHRVFLPADMQKEGMQELLNKHHHLRKHLKGGVDILVAPHHGLRSSFSVEMFKEMKNEKTRCLHVVSEKESSADSRRVVDGRYSQKEYCSGDNNLKDDNGLAFQVKTSRGHVFIDYRPNDRPKIEIINNNIDLINRFL